MLANAIFSNKTTFSIQTSFMVPDIRIVTIPEWIPNKPNEVIISVTNKSEIDLNVSFVPLSQYADKSEDYRNLSGFTPTASISVGSDADKPILIERQDSAKAQSAALRPLDSNLDEFVKFRRDNKIAVKCTVTPLDESDFKSHVRVAFELKHCLDHKAVADAKQADPVVTRLSTSQKVFIDFGPLKGGKVIHTPRYIDDLNGTVKIESK